MEQLRQIIDFKPSAEGKWFLLVTTIELKQKQTNKKKQVYSYVPFKENDLI